MAVQSRRCSRTWPACAPANLEILLGQTRRKTSKKNLKIWRGWAPSSTHRSVGLIQALFEYLFYTIGTELNSEADFGLPIISYNLHPIHEGFVQLELDFDDDEVESSSFWICLSTASPKFGYIFVQSGTGKPVEIFDSFEKFLGGFVAMLAAYTKATSAEDKRIALEEFYEQYE